MARAMTTKRESSSMTMTRRAKTSETTETTMMTKMRERSLNMLTKDKRNDNSV